MDLFDFKATACDCMLWYYTCVTYNIVLNSILNDPCIESQLCHTITAPLTEVVLSTDTDINKDTWDCEYYSQYSSLSAVQETPSKLIGFPQKLTLVCESGTPGMNLVRWVSPWMN